MGLQLFWFLQGTEVYVAAHGLPHCELPVPKSQRSTFGILPIRRGES